MSNNLADNESVDPRLTEFVDRAVEPVIVGSVAVYHSPIWSIWPVRSWYMFKDANRVDEFQNDVQWRRAELYGYKSEYPRTPQEVDQEILSHLKSGKLIAFLNENPIDRDFWKGKLAINGHFGQNNPYFERADVLAAQRAVPKATVIETDSSQAAFDCAHLAQLSCGRADPTNSTVDAVPEVPKAVVKLIKEARPVLVQELRYIEVKLENVFRQGDADAFDAQQAVNASPKNKKAIQSELERRKGVGLSAANMDDKWVGAIIGQVKRSTYIQRAHIVANSLFHEGFPVPFDRVAAADVRAKLVASNKLPEGAIDLYIDRLKKYLEQFRE